MGGVCKKVGGADQPRAYMEMEGPRQESALKSSLRKSMAMLRQAAAKYEEVIVKDPDFTSKLETVLRVASYILPGAHYLGCCVFLKPYIQTVGTCSSILGFHCMCGVNPIMMVHLTCITLPLEAQILPP